MKFSVILFLLASLGVAAGCSAAPDDSDDNVTDEAEGELSTAGQKVVGSYVNDGAGTAGNLRGLVLKSDGTFFADLDTGIRCVVAPCPSNERIEGTFTAGAKTVTLKAPNATQRAKGYLGRFRYVRTDSSIELTKSGNTMELAVAESYCTEASDCYGQSMIVPACFPLRFSCTDTRTCSFSCSPPPLDPCRGLDQQECQDRGSLCRAEFGPSSCVGTPPNQRCTRDFVFKSCSKR